jgi:hypothetical protein
MPIEELGETTTITWPQFAPIFADSLPPNHDMTRANVNHDYEVRFALEKCPHCGKPLSE